MLDNVLLMHISFQLVSCFLIVQQFGRGAGNKLHLTNTILLEFSFAT